MSGYDTITCGGLDEVYPKPGLVITGVVIEPPTIETVAVAVLPTPTPIVDGDAILMVAEPEYPVPKLTTLSEEIVPAVETTAVTAADTGSVP